MQPQCRRLYGYRYAARLPVESESRLLARVRGLVAEVICDVVVS